MIAIDRITFSDTDLWFGTMCQGSVNAVEQFAIVQRLLENDLKAGSGCTMVEVVADLGSDEDRRTIDPALTQFSDKLYPGHAWHVVIDHEASALRQIRRGKKLGTVLEQMHGQTLKLKGELQ